MPELAPASLPDVRAFLLEVGSALHRYGTPSYRLEEWLEILALKFGLEGHFFCTPTALFAAFGPPGDQHTSLVRIASGEVNLGKLADLDRILNRVWSDEISPGEGRRQVNAAAADTRDYPRGVSMFCHALACATAARIFGAGVRQMLVAGAIGAVIGVLARLMGKRPNTARLFEPVAALLATVLVHCAQSLIGTFDVTSTTLSSVIVLLPGFSLTVAIKELAVRHLASGTARLAGALVTLFSIGIGTFAGTRIGELLPAQSGEVGDALPGWTLWPAVALAPCAYAVLFRARMRDFGAIWIAAMLAFLALYYGSRLSHGPVFGAALGALVVGVFANLYAWRTDRPATVPMVPGIMMLVPGSLGFRSMESMFATLSLSTSNNEVIVAGVSTAFQMAFVAFALVGGLLLANVVLPPRKIL